MDTYSENGYECMCLFFIFRLRAQPTLLVITNGDIMSFDCCHVLYLSVVYIFLMELAAHLCMTSTYPDQYYVKNDLHHAYVTMYTRHSLFCFNLLSNNRPVDFDFLDAVSTTQYMAIDDETDRKNEYIYIRPCILSTMDFFENIDD